VLAKSQTATSLLLSRAERATLLSMTRSEEEDVLRTHTRMST
jgi:hypothetical protein